MAFSLDGMWFAAAGTWYVAGLKQQGRGGNGALWSMTTGLKVRTIEHQPQQVNGSKLRHLRPALPAFSKAYHAALARGLTHLAKFRGGPGLLSGATCAVSEPLNRFLLALNQHPLAQLADRPGLQVARDSGPSRGEVGSLVFWIVFEVLGHVSWGNICVFLHFFLHSSKL